MSGEFTASETEEGCCEQSKKYDECNILSECDNPVCWTLDTVHIDKSPKNAHEEESNQAPSDQVNAKGTTQFGFVGISSKDTAARNQDCCIR